MKNIVQNVNDIITTMKQCQFGACRIEILKCINQRKNIFIFQSYNVRKATLKKYEIQYSHVST